MLAVRRLDDDRYEARFPGSGYLFGGCTLSVSLLAAADTVAEMSPRSVQAQFLRSGEWEKPTTLRVTRWPDTRSFATRAVTVSQDDRVLAVVLVSFHRPEQGGGWQRDPMAAVPLPDELPPSPVHLPSPLMEVRRVGGSDESVRTSWHPYWARGTGTFGEDEAKHHAALLFISDYVVIFSLHDARPVVAPSDSVRTISHSVWFHRPVRADRWHLFASEPRSVSDGRGLTLGTVSAEDGSLVASFAQEVIIRP